MLRVLSSTARFLASPQSVRTLTLKPHAVSGEVVDQMRDYNLTKTVLGAVNTQIEKDSHSRLFAVVYLLGKQYKVTAEDLVSVEAHIAADVGETITLNKVLLVGSTDFTLIGRPLIEPSLVKVYATVVESTLGHEFRIFFRLQRTRYQRSYFHRIKSTVLRINGIEITRPIDQ